MLRAFYTDITGSNGVRRLLSFAWSRCFTGPVPEMAKDGFGKPYFPSRSDVFFSLSHARTHSMVVIGDEPCGCDIETERQVRENLIRRVCSESEMEYFGFLDLWVLKESLIKLIGRLPCDYRELTFSAGPEGVRCLYAMEGSYPRVQLYRAGDLRAAVVTSGTPPERLEFVDGRVI